MGDEEEKLILTDDQLRLLKYLIDVDMVPYATLTEVDDDNFKVI